MREAKRWPARRVGRCDVARAAGVLGSLYYTFSLLMPSIERELGLARVEVGGAFGAALLAAGAVGWPVGRAIERGRGRAVMTGGSLLAAALLAALAGSIRGPRCTHAGPAWASRWAPCCTSRLRDPDPPVARRLPPLADRDDLPRRARLDRLHPAVGGAGRCAGLARHLPRARGAAPAAVRADPRGDAGRRAGGPDRDGWPAGAGDARRAVAGLAAGGARAPIDPAAGLRAAPSLRVLAATPAFLAITGFAVASAALTSALSAHMVPMLRERGLDDGWSIAVPASIGAVQVLGRLVLFVFEGRLDADRLDRAIPLLLPVSIALLLAGGASVAGALAFAACFGIANGLVTIVKATAVARYVDRDRVASLSGLQALPVALARASGPVALAALWDAGGDYRLGLWALLVTGAAGAALMRVAQARALPPRASVSAGASSRRMGQ
jgi:hypothetical protein